MSATNTIYKLFPTACLDLVYAYNAGFVHALQGYGFSGQRPDNYTISEVNMYQLGWIDAQDYATCAHRPYPAKRTPQVDENRD